MMENASDKYSSMGTAEKNLEGTDVVPTEETIERNFKTFRSYIETCVKATDLIAFYDLFTTEQSRKYQQLFRSDSTGATAMAFDDIEQMENQHDKYTRFLTAMEDAGYPKIVRILKGELLPVGSEHRQKIRKSFKDIYQDLFPDEVLPHLFSMNVISHNEYEEIIAAERNYSKGFAIIELLLILPNRHKDWYKHFLEALVCSSHEHLAKLIDEELTKRIIQSGEGKVYHGSGQVSPRAERCVHVVTSCKSPENQPNTKYTLCTQSPPQDLSEADFVPCKNCIAEKAKCYCTNCSENICEQCNVHHLLLHRVIENFPKSVIPDVQLPTAKPLCDCGHGEKEFYCKTHVDLVCSTCNTEKHESCDVLSIDSISAAFILDKFKTVGETKVLISKIIEKVLSEREKAERILTESIKKCKADVSYISDKINAYLEKIMTEIEMAEKKHQERIDAHIKSCHLSLYRLTGQYERTCTRTREPMFSGQRIKALDSVLRLESTLEDTRKFLSEIDENFRKPLIIFKINEKLLEIMNHETLGKIELAD